jgi:hypothetical protein
MGVIPPSEIVPDGLQSHLGLCHLHREPDMPTIFAINPGAKRSSVVFWNTKGRFAE